MKLHHAALVCSSQENADRFYEGVLGLKKIKASVLNKDLSKQIFDTAFECLFFLYGNEDLAVEVFVITSHEAKNNPFAHLCLEVENPDTFLKKCRSEGLEVRLIPRGDSKLIFLKDYDGNLFEIKGPPI